MMSDELAAEEFDKHPENDFTFGGYVWRMDERGADPAIYHKDALSESLMWGLDYVVREVKGWLYTRGWKTEAQHFQDQYGSRGVAEMPNERENDSESIEEFQRMVSESYDRGITHKGTYQEWWDAKQGYKDKLKTLTPPCILAGHVMIDGGGKVKWCNNCDKEERLNSEGVWV